jgi:hypothetical protein
MPEHFYRPLLRPPGFATLPAGLKWDYAEVPLDVAPQRPGKPLSRFLYGVIVTDRALTQEELQTYDLIAYQQ